VSTGKLDIQAGAVQVASGGGLLNSGQLALTAGTTLYMDRVTLAAGSTFAGAGTLSLNGTTTVTGDLTVTLPTQYNGTLTGSGTWHVAAPMTWHGGYLVLAGGMEVLSGQTVTFPNNNTVRWVIDSSLTNRGTVAMGATNGVGYQGSQVTVRNESGASWTMTGNGLLSSNGGPGIPGGFKFQNFGTMSGTGNTLSVAGTIGFSNSGTITGITIVQ